MENQRLTVLFYPVSSLGHINGCIGLAEAIHERGHRVVFLAERYWEGMFEKCGFEERLYDGYEEYVEKYGKPWIDNYIKNLFKSGSDLNDGFLKLCKMETKSAQYVDPYIRRVVSEVRPDVIIDENMYPSPALILSKIPIVKLFTTNPKVAFVDEYRPQTSSTSFLSEEQSKRTVSEKKIDLLYWEGMIEYNDWLKSLNIPPVPVGRSFHFSENLNIYVYPKDMVEDYLGKISLGEEWMGLDHSIRKSDGNFEMPSEFKALPGKVVYVSLGSIASSIINLMERLISILSKSKHKFVVCTGSCHEDIKLAPNMWGQPFLPQLDVLPLVDLVITHGGNNSFVETLYFGKPMIVLPLFFDQPLNAQRAVETNVGCKFNFFKVGDELCEAIDRLLNDESVLSKVEKISKRTQESKSMEKVVERIEFVAKNPK